MNQNMRNLVEEGYNKGAYDKVYARKNTKLDSFEQFMLEELVSRTKKSGRLLDLGCGVGLPYDGYLVNKGFAVTGIDISKKHVRLARKNVPKATFFQGDFFSENITGTFDAIVSFYALFHIPRKEHKKLLHFIYSKLNKDAFVLITLGAESMKKDVNKNFVGAPMAWSSFSIQKNKRLVRTAGFKIILSVEDCREEHHLWILAKKE